MESVGGGRIASFHMVRLITHTSCSHCCALYPCKCATLLLYHCDYIDDRKNNGDGGGRGRGRGGRIYYIKTT